eukprot:TRINITY_DN7596_c0_g1_i1.p1 TRINITY_DN7596_c0_g1~~TRINITY_DN7596_c0_g1_i1.p1  ORF type:complete len:277 (+),score=81.04 TRINITY_DN7596_c0_g1_i1:64-894(+)
MAGRSALALLVLSACAVAFSAVALKSVWWSTSLTVQSSTNSSVAAGTVFQTKFYLTKLKNINGIEGTSTTKNYSNLPILDTSLFKDIRIMAITVTAASFLVFLYSLACLAAPRKVHRAAPVFSLLSLSCCLLAVASMILLAWVPNDIEDSIANALNRSTSSSFCGSASFTWGSYTFEGQTIRCGNIWKTYEFALTGSSGTTAEIEYSTEAGAGWWWMFGSSMASLFGTFAAGLTRNAGVEEKREEMREEHELVPDHSSNVDDKEKIVPEAPPADTA